MGVMQVSFWGASIKKQCQMMVCYPDRVEAKGPFPVLYLLHGLSDDHTIWTRHTSLERYLSGMPLIVAMPDGHRAFYTDAVEGLAYEQNLIKDVVETVDRFFRTRAERAGRCISGLSMGGYGAMKLALKHPDLFVSATSHSGALRITSIKKRPELQPQLRRIFGKGVGAGGPDDCFALAERAKRKKAKLPALRFDCGVDDGLLDHNRAFHAHLEKLRIPHEYEEFPGAHTWGYWDVHVRESLAFHARHLGIAGKPKPS